MITAGLNWQWTNGIKDKAQGRSSLATRVTWFLFKLICKYNIIYNNNIISKTSPSTVCHQTGII